MHVKKTTFPLKFLHEFFITATKYMLKLFYYLAYIAFK